MKKSLCVKNGNKLEFKKQNVIADGWRQVDQIGRIFAYWVVVYFG
jgi:hypothetical protein